MIPIYRGGIPASIARPLVATLGNFDGVHRGHQQLLQRVVQRRAAAGTAAVISFYPHPQKVIAAKSPELVTTLRQRMRLFEQFDINCYVPLRFTKALAAKSAAQFVEEFLCQRIHLDYLVIGADTHIGRGREGDAATIARLVTEKGIGVEVLPLFTLAGQKAGSGAVRDLIRSGALADAETMLGRPYAIEGRVVTGDKRGRTIGTPTANIHARQITPARGVYATRAIFKGRTYAAVTNVGVRPTFGGIARETVETFLLDYHGPEFYGELLEVQFIEHIREEQKFSGIEALKTQIQIDIAKAREITTRAR
jgi:riboflavin kinase / FMN adenylyltransferase